MGYVISLKPHIEVEDAGISIAYVLEIPQSEP